LIGDDEGRSARDRGNYYVVLPQFGFQRKHGDKPEAGTALPEGFAYRSDTNTDWLTVPKLQGMIQEFTHGL
jgi:UDP-N-acetylglucosamine 4,6-dehydratase/5-epimerase